MIELNTPIHKWVCVMASGEELIYICFAYLCMSVHVTAACFADKYC